MSEPLRVVQETQAPIEQLVCVGRLLDFLGLHEACGQVVLPMAEDGIVTDAELTRNNAVG